MNRRIMIFSGLIAAVLSTSSASAAMQPYLSQERYGLVFLRGRETSETVLKSSFQRIFDSGFRRIVIPYWGCQPGIESNEVGACETVPGSVFVLQARVAKSVGLRVSFLPIVGTPNNEWRGVFKPTDLDRWFETYGIWIKRVGRDARDLGMSELVVATEFSAFIYRETDRWKKLLKEIRTESFTGSLIVTINWDHPEFHFWSEADAFGISSYFPLQIGPFKRSLETMAVANRDNMKKRAKKAGKPVYVVEYGFPSLKTAANKPWHYPSPPEVPVQDLDLQARCYDAFLKSWTGDSEIIGMNSWASSDPDHPVSATSFEVLGKPVEAVLKRFLQSGI